MIQAITGPNFSGKSFYLQCFSGFPTDRVKKVIKGNTSLFRDSRNDLYLGPIPDYFFSGFFSSVKAEIFKYQNPSISNDPALLKYIEESNLIDLYSRDVSTLSGGEKAIVSTLAFSISNPRSLSIDCTLEQLSPTWKTSILKFLLGSSIPEIILIDSRISEIPGQFFKEVEYKAIPEPYDIEMMLNNINSNNIYFVDDYRKNMISVNDLCFSFPKKELFKNFSFQLESGKIYHLKGENGVGKSTLSKILSGLLKLDKKNKVLLNQSEIALYPHPGKYVGYTFQQPDDQLFSKTVGEELGFRGEGNKNSFYVETIIDAFGLMPLINFHPFELPISMRKRLSIAATLTVERPFYILDEPTLYMDDSNVAELKRIVEKLAFSGKGIVLISHSEHFIKSFDHIETIEINQN